MTTISDHIQNPAAVQQPEYSVSEHRTIDKPVRILHVLGGMDRGGVETWLMHVLRHIDRQQFHMDFLVHTDRRCAYDDEIEALGSSIYYCPKPSNPLQYAWNFRRILREQGPYDVVHSHVHHFSGFVLWLAKAAGVKQRIAHSHTDSYVIDYSGSLFRRLYLRRCRQLLDDYATVRLAASARAAASLFGSAWQSTQQVLVSHCGIDLEPFDVPLDRIAVRQELGFRPHDFVVGHVGRFVAVKNHDFLLKIYVEILKTEPNARLLLIGDGPLITAVRQSASHLEILDRVLFTGSRVDVARLMRGAMDVFVMPSAFEGLGLAAIEAQAAGIPTILSDRIPEEADTGCGLVRFVPLDNSEACWAQHILTHSKLAHLGYAQALMHVKATPFNLTHSLEALLSRYSASSHVAAN